jgi:hypothetical protein
MKRVLGFTAVGISIFVLFVNRIAFMALGTTLYEVDARWWVLTAVFMLLPTGSAALYMYTRNHPVRHRIALQWMTTVASYVVMIASAFIMGQVATTKFDDEGAAVSLGLLCGALPNVLPLLMRTLLNASLGHSVLQLFITNAVMVWVVISRNDKPSGYRSVLMIWAVLLATLVGAALYTSERAARKGFLDQIRIAELQREVEVARTEKAATLAAAEAAARKAEAGGELLSLDPHKIESPSILTQILVC